MSRDAVSTPEALATTLPPGAVLAHVVTEERFTALFNRRPRCWAKIGDEAWRSVADVRIGGGLLMIEPCPWPDRRWRDFAIVTPSVTWEQPYGLRGRHEVMGAVG